jgi:phosphoserine phosphatase
MSWALSLVVSPSPTGLESGIATGASAVLAELGCVAGDPRWLAPGIACEISLNIPADPSLPLRIVAALRAKLAGANVDIALQPAVGRRKRLLFADMESTIIAEELLDQIGQRIGLAERIEAITRRAMRGEIEYAQSLRERVALLNGLAVKQFAALGGSITLNPGARRLVQTMRAHGAHTVLVSGGFDIFARLVREQCGFHADFANRLIVAGEQLSGEVAEPILDRQGKRAIVERIAAEQGLSTDAAIAVGDGANDIDMLKAAGLGVAYRGKAAVKAVVPCHLDHADLSALLFFQGYHADEFRD